MGKENRADPQTLEQRAAQRYDDCHSNDRFSDLKRRAAFSKEERMLLQDWLAAAMTWPTAP